MEKSEMFVYIFWVLTFVGSLIFPTFYTPFILGIFAVYFAEKVKKQNKKKGNILIIVSVIIMLFSAVFVMGAWYIFLAGLF